ncbi:EamA family transporter [Vibrio sp. TH_r3]|uniref:EamA family transporter n=1 Tax=Vibrio sp. TH_r3 TaxID=3082084 RepID=UPI002953EF90|nr:EamA family transporter [Vibrio sp. TH_r3]MDV7105144.1 EamA family transporter [Vibrio sp. TH_r3]
MLLGVFSSFLGAFFQALNYILTQNCQQKNGIDGVKLLVAVHVGIGLLALIPTVVLGYWQLVTLDLIWDFVLINFPYLVAQYLLIIAIRYSDASIVSPLLALKIPVLAIISVLFYQAGFSTIQWMTIGIILAIAWYFSMLSGSINIKPLLLIFGASVGYSLSDMAITNLSHKLLDGSPVEQSFATICVNYLACGVMSIPLIRPMKVTIATVYHARWVALAWFFAVIFLILGFNISGVVSGNIVQSLRGVIGVIFAYVLFRKQVDQPVALWRKKLFAAMGMFVAVGLFYC